MIDITITIEKHKEDFGGALAKKDAKNEEKTYISLNQKGVALEPCHYQKVRTTLLELRAILEKY